MLYLIVFLGAGIGGALRHGVNVGAARLFGYGFPFGTLIVNIAGSFAMGLFAGYFAFRPGIAQHMRLFLAFSLDTALLIERHAYWLAAAYVAGSIAASILVLFAGMSIFRIQGHIP